jgi:hypothetical protein
MQEKSVPRMGWNGLIEALSIDNTFTAKVINRFSGEMQEEPVWY